MRIDQLRLFIHVAETCSLTQSAKYLHISQQGLSQVIKSLEKELGTTLFNRNANRIFLTEEGEKTAEKAKEILYKYDEILTELKPSLQTTTRYQELQIFATPLMNKIFMQKLLFDFINKYPQITTNLTEHTPLEIIDEIISTKNAIGILSIRRYVLETSKTFKTSDIIFEKLTEFGVFASVAKTSPLATKKILTTKELIKHPIVVYNAGQNIKTITDLFQDIGKPNLKVVTTDWDLYQKTIANGIAIGISNCLSRNFQKNGLFVNVPIKTTSKFNLLIGYAISNKQPQYPFIKDFIKILKKISAKEFL